MKFAHVYNEIERPSKALIEGFGQISSATAHEASGKKGALTSAIKPVAAGMRVCGPALTVLCRSKDNLMLHKAIAVARPGDVLVVATEDKAEAGFWGEIMTVSAQANGIAGLVIDNCARCRSNHRQRLPGVFARTVHQRHGQGQSGVDQPPDSMRRIPGVPGRSCLG